MRWLRWAGVAGLVGVIATGVILARSRRRWRDVDNTAIREHLHARFDQARAAA